MFDIYNNVTGGHALKEVYSQCTITCTITTNLMYKIKLLQYPKHILYLSVLLFYVLNGSVDHFQHHFQLYILFC